MSQPESFDPNSFTLSSAAVKHFKNSLSSEETDVGIICSGNEAKTVRKIIGPDLLIFTPGIRMNKDNRDDQQRICTPIESIRNGSDKIIMGRSLIKGNIEENLNQVAASIKI